jgi:hypothetical protein
MFNVATPSGLINEDTLAGQPILTLAVNVPQVGTRTTSIVGGMFRLDTRTAEQRFVVLGYPTGGSVATERISVNLQNGATYFNPAEGNTGIGLAVATSLSSKLQVNGSAAIGYSASTTAPTNGLAVNGTANFGSTGTTTIQTVINNGIVITGASTTGTPVVALNATGAANNNQSFDFRVSGATKFAFGYTQATTNRFFIYNAVTLNDGIRIVESTNNVSIGNFNALSTLEVGGNMAIGFSGVSAPTNGLSISGTTNIGTNTSVTTAKLQVSSTTQGFLPPVMTTTQKNAIVSPATGLVVFDSTLGKLCVFSGTWQTITSV